MPFHEAMDLWEQALEEEMRSTGFTDELMALQALGDTLNGLVLPWMPVGDS